MKIKLELALIEDLLRRPITNRDEYRSKKAQLDANIKNKSPEEIGLILTSLERISSRHVDSQNYCKLYEKYLSQLLAVPNNDDPPSLPVDFYFTEQVRYEIFTQILDKFNKIYLAKNLETFNCLKNHQPRINTSEKWKKISKKFALNFISKSAQNLNLAVKTWNFSAIHILQKVSSIQNKSTKSYRLLLKVGKLAFKRTVKVVFIQVRLIKIFFKRIQNPLEHVVDIKQSKCYADALIMFKRNVRKANAPKQFLSLYEKIYSRYSAYLFKAIKLSNSSIIQSPVIDHLQHKN